MLTIGDWLLNAMCIVGVGGITLILLLLGICGALACLKWICDFVKNWKEDSK